MNEETHEETMARHHAAMEIPTTPAGIVGARVRERRMARGWTQELLGEALQRLLGKAWSKQMISAVETGRKDLSVTEVLAFAAALGRPVQDLLAPSLAQEIRFPAGSVEGLQMRALVLGALEPGTRSLVVEIVRKMRDSIAIAEGGLEAVKLQLAMLERLKEVQP